MSENKVLTPDEWGAVLNAIRPIHTAGEFPATALAALALYDAALRALALEALEGWRESNNNARAQGITSVSCWQNTSDRIAEIRKLLEGE